MAAAKTHVNQAGVSAELKTLLKEYPELRVNKNGKVCCCLTGHEMPPREDVVLSHVQGKKFLRAQSQIVFDFDQYKPHLVPNTKKGFGHTLFCTLTLRCVTKRPADVERHVNGKRYKRALQRWQKCQETGEKFKPRGGRKNRGDSVRQENNSGSDRDKSSRFWEAGSEDEEDSANMDDLKDLYPSDDLASSEEEEDIGDSDSGTAGPAPQNAVNGNSHSNKTLKRKTSQKEGDKKKKKKKRT